jgi:DNA primase
VISRETIDKIFDTARIEEVIGDFVQLKKSGSSLKGLSPFSNERTPSFMVSPSKQIFKDFSSGKGGTVVSFLMEHEHYTYPEALRYLAKKYNIEVEEDQQTDAQKESRNLRESLFLVNEYANKFFQKQLWQTPVGKQIGLSYFKERGFTDETLKTFQLGYSQDDFESFTQTALSENYQLEFLEKSGLTQVKGSKKYDRFRGRVMFPILSHTGRVLGFGGRTLQKEAKIAKYLNSPESEIYHKSKILYGIYQAKAEIGKADECFLVEGYTDVISLHQAGVKNVVASSGTALTVDQIDLIKRYTRNITLLYDGDQAGIKASLRGIDLILERGMEVSVVLFPEGEDPDSYAKSVSTPELKDYLKEEKTNFLRFKAKLLLQDAGDSPIEKSRAAREMVKSITLIPDPLERDAYVQETAALLNIEERVLFSELGQMVSQKQAQKERDAQREKMRQERSQQALEKVEDQETSEPANDTLSLSPLHEQEKALCWLLLNHGAKEFEFTALADEEDDPLTEAVAVYILTELAADDLDFEHPIYKAILEKFAYYYNEQEQIIKAESFLRDGDKAVMHTVVDLIADEPGLHKWEKKNIYPPAQDAFVPRHTQESILRFKEKKISQIIAKLETELKAQNEPQREDIETLIRLNKLRVEINHRLNRVV